MGIPYHHPQKPVTTKTPTISTKPTLNIVSDRIGCMNRSQSFDRMTGFAGFT
jgi:hypothetical protein